MDQRMFAHLEIHGHRESCLAFIEGFRLARGEDDVFFSDEAGFELPTLLDSIASGLHRETHLVAPLSFLEEMIAAMERSSRLKLKTETPRPLSGARLSFEFKCYSADEGRAIRRLIEEELPEGVRLEDYELEEKIDSEAKGPELYSPMHDYILVGKGMYQGSFEAVGIMARRLQNQDFVHPGKIDLEYAD